MNTNRARHVLFWLVWWLVQSLLMGDGKDLLVYLPKEVAMVSLQMVVVYINWFFLHPYLFKQRRFMLYGISSVALIYGVFIVSFTWIEWVLDQLHFLFPAVITADFPDISFDYHFWQWFSGSVPYSLALVVSLVVNIYLEKEKDKKEKELLASEKQQLEITYLRNQINPHFLFNSLNNIHSLILQDKSSASEYTIALSNVMRHMLYEVKHDTISLEKEINCVENLLGLISIRNNGSPQSLCTINIEYPQVPIIPLLISSIVENGIKHSGIEYLVDARLELDIVEINQLLQVSMVNSLRPHVHSEKDDAGIGLESLKKRLALNYPGKHNFTFDIVDEQALTKLEIDLS